MAGFGRGAANADLDHDGDLDLVIARSGNPMLYMNQNISGNWVQISLTGNGNTNISAIGARVRLVAQISEQGGNTVQLREISSQTGAASQNSLTAHFGLGDASQIDSLILIWPTTGNEEVFTNLAVNQFYSFIESEVSTLEEDNQTLTQFRLYENYPNPFNPTTFIRYEIGSTQNVELVVFNTLGQKVSTLVKQQQKAGSYSARFDGQGFANGVYYYKLSAGNNVQARKMILLK